MTKRRRARQNHPCTSAHTPACTSLNSTTDARVARVWPAARVPAADEPVRLPGQAPGQRVGETAQDKQVGSRPDGSAVPAWSVHGCTVSPMSHRHCTLVLCTYYIRFKGQHAKSKKGKAKAPRTCRPQPQRADTAASSDAVKRESRDAVEKPRVAACPLGCESCAVQYGIYQSQKGENDTSNARGCISVRVRPWRAAAGARPPHPHHWKRQMDARAQPIGLRCRWSESR